MMKIRLSQILLGLDYSEDQILKAAAGRLGISVEALLSCVVTRRSIDARGTRGRVRFSLCVEVDVCEEVGNNIFRDPGARKEFEILPESETSDLTEINTSVATKL